MPSNQTQDWSRKPFKEAVDFFKQKKLLQSLYWDEVQKSAHDQSFTVAGLTKRAALQEMFNAILKQFQSGISFNAFQKDFDSLVKKHGWEHRGDRAWRARVIFETNIRTAYTAGRWAQLQDPDAAKALPYIQYKHSGVENYRPQHKAWDGLVLLRTDKFWQTNLPPNGWGCKCQFFPISKRALTRLGKAGPDENPYDVMARQGLPTTRVTKNRSSGVETNTPIGVDAGWDYAPGSSWANRYVRGVKDAKLNAAKLYDAPMWPDTVLEKGKMPTARLFPADKILPKDISDADAVRSFMAEFGKLPDVPFLFKDASGQLVTISNSFFIEDGTGASKLTSERRKFILMMAQTILSPDEIVEAFEQSRNDPNKYFLKRRYLARWILADNTKLTFAAFTEASVENEWLASSTFPVGEAYYDGQRKGRLAYRRK